MNMLQINKDLAIAEEELEITAIRSQGKGGQNVNKVATAILLGFDVLASSLPAESRAKILAYYKNKITKDGKLLIKTQKFRTQEQNKKEAVRKLLELLRLPFVPVKKRTPTKPSLAAKKKRLLEKKQRSEVKKSRKSGFD